jgi:putative endopeptidase
MDNEFIMEANKQEEIKQVTPRSNFYYYVNQKWLDDPANKIPDEYPYWGGFVKLSDQCLKNQIQLVKDICNKNPNEKTINEQKISFLWKASMNRFENWKNEDTNMNYDPISRELEILDAYLMPNISITDDEDMVIRIAEYFYYTQMNGITNIFDFDKGSDLTNSNNIVLDLTTNGLSLPTREYYLESNLSNKLAMFRKHLDNVSKLINDSNCTTHLDENFVNNIMNFETEMASYKMKKEQTRQYSDYYTNTTLSELHTKVNDLISLKEKEENYPLEKRNFKLDDYQVNLTVLFFEKIYELFEFRKKLKDNIDIYFTSKNVPSPPHNEHITVFDGDAVRKFLAMIFEKDNFLKYRSFLQYKIVSTFNAFCSKELNDEFFDFYSRKLKGQEKQKTNEKRSIEFINSYVGEMMGELYVKKYFPENHKKTINEAIQEIIITMTDSIKNNDWLTKVTKEKALQKLSKFGIKIGYPDVWKDYGAFYIEEDDSLYDIFKKYRNFKNKVDFFEKINSTLDHNEWHMLPQTVNAYFSPTNNEIVFPAAILQPPFYCKVPDDIDTDLSEERNMCKTSKSNMTNDDFVRAVNYGGIYAVIAHEITHGYDDNGKKFDGDGNLNNWWTDEDAALFKEKTNIMSDQANSYKFIDTDDYNKEYKLSPQLTMGENLADIGGISLSLKTMTSKLKRRNASDNDIRVCQRIMFKSFANIWKENIKKEYQINLLTTDRHPPPDFRANLVKNMDEFYSAFDVNESDQMFIPPTKRIRMW